MPRPRPSTTLSSTATCCSRRKSFGLDYNDLIILTLHLFDTCPEVRRAWQERMEYVMVDEFQDIDGLQYALMEALAGHHGNLFVVGDPDQTIYTWRGADVRYLLDFDKPVPGTRTVMMLETTGRRRAWWPSRTR